MRVLVAYCSATRELFSHAVPRKGADSEGYAVEQLKQDALWLGHSKLTILGDNEPALVQAVDRTHAALRLSGVQSASAEGSVPYGPQTNGAVQRESGETGQLEVRHHARLRVPQTHSDLFSPSRRLSGPKARPYLRLYLPLRVSFLDY